MARQFNVHQEWDHILVACSYHSNFRYRVFFGTVNWSDTAEDLTPAYVVFVQQGDTIWYDRPAHIMPEDLDSVVSALQELRRRRIASP
jgi:hypothetical protein